MAGESGAIIEGDRSDKNEEIILIKETGFLLLEELEEEQNVSVRQPVVYRADPSLRHLRKHFEGALISLGLFDRCSWDGFHGVTKEKNSLKINVLTAFLADIGKAPEDWARISERVVDDPVAVQSLYEQHPHFDLPREVIRSALALDSIFLACLLMYIYCDSIPSIYYFKFRRTFKCLSRERVNTINELCFDSFKMENQIPLVLIRNVVAIIVESQNVNPDQESSVMPGMHTKVQDELLQTICFSWTVDCSRIFPRSQISRSDLKFEECHHLLHCVAKAFWHGAKAHRLEEIQSKGTSRTSRLWRSQQGDNSDRYAHFLPTAEELHKRGITFQGQDDFFPRFKQRKFTWWKATLYLPKILCIENNTEVFWRNFLAFESAYTKDFFEMSFAHYLFFMDDLINTERDVLVLLRGRHPVILEVGLRDNQAVADLFNSISKNVYSNYDSEWLSIIHQINAFNNNGFGRKLEEFEQTYCSKPWLLCSIFAAFILLILTFLQTFYAIWTFHHPHLE